MNKLSKYLTEQLLLGEDSDNSIQKTIVVYSGRFQPFHVGHYHTYNQLVKKFGKKNVYIGTSNKTDSTKSPFDFKEKSKIISTMFGISKSNIVQIKNPYAPTEILSKFDKNTTAYVTAVGEKDASRLGGKYFKKYDSNIDTGYETRGYVYIVPKQPKAISGTDVRNNLTIGSDEDKKKYFTKTAYPKFNQSIFDLVTSKLEESFVIDKDVIKEWLLKESTVMTTGQADDGPASFVPNYNVFKKLSVKRAEKIGYEVVNMITTKDVEDYYEHPTYPYGPVPAVSYFPAGVLGTMTPNNQVDIYSSKAYSKWFKHITRTATLTGYELIKTQLQRDAMADIAKMAGDDAKGDLFSQEEFEASLSEVIKLPVEIGDTILMGKWKNKKVVVKTIGKDEHGMPTINGKKVVTFRLGKKGPNIFENIVELEEDTLTMLREGNDKLKLTIPNDIKKIHKIFKKNGKKLYVVGGAVRDAILGKNPKDFDMATDAKPDEVLKIARENGFGTAEVGKSFGVVLINGHEFATFRKDIGKGRRPDAVDYTDIEGDVKRRDLTINALFYDMDRNEIVDLVGGIADLKNKNIRTVGVAKDRFDEDPLRKLRALRFSGKLNGKLDKDTYNALKDDSTLTGVSVERIRDEFIKSLKSATSTKKYMELIDKLGYTKLILPNIKVSKPYIDENDYIVFLSYILRDNKTAELGKKLHKLTYTMKNSKEIPSILFLMSLHKFTPEQIFQYKKSQDRTSLTDDQILTFGKLIGKDFKKLVNHKLSISGNDAPPELKGAAVKTWIDSEETKLYLGEDIKQYNCGITMSESMIYEIESIKSFKQLFSKLPSDLQKRVMALKNLEQDPKHHPEGNVLKHTITVVNRAIKHNPDDIDLLLAAIFHDIGKDSTHSSNIKTKRIQHLGHEETSAELVKKHAKFILSMGGKPSDVFYIVKHHMRMKNFDIMKLSKKRKLTNYGAFDKLDTFNKKLDGGGFAESIDEDLFSSSLKMKPHETLIVNSVIEFMKSKYGFDAKIIVKKKESKGMIGDVVLNDNSLNNNKFYLHFNPSQSITMMIKSLIHELTHVKQISRKELKPSDDYKMILWKNKPIISVSDYKKTMKNFGEYKKLPWESEAYINMAKLYKTFLNSSQWKRLSGGDNIDYIKQNIGESYVLQDLEKKYNIELELYDNGDYLSLDKIIIPKSERGGGIGTKVMDILIKYSDKVKKPIYLTPSNDYGASSVSRLTKFYKNFGFVKNTDKSKTKATMVRVSEMAKADLNKIEKYAEKQLSPEDIEFGKHFFDRLNDKRNGKEISVAELTGFFKRLSKYKKKFKEFLEKYQQLVVKDKRHNINIPFMTQTNQIIAKTIMRKKDFKTSNKVITIERVNFVPDIVKKSKTWYMLSKKDVLTISGDVIDLIQTAYKNTKGYHVNNKKDIDRSVFWDVIDVDGEFDADTVIFGRKSPFGIKIQGIGHDGEQKSKKVVIAKIVKLLNTTGYWIEASDALENVLYKSGTNYIKSEKVVQSVFPNSELKMTGNKGQYTRKLESGKTITETIFGKPKVSVKETTDTIGELYDDMVGSLESFVLKTPITEGGAYGHMNHPFDTEINLTFAQLKDIVNKGLDGELEVTKEKTDGQALSISWRDGKLIAARNKGHLKNRGKDALDIKGVSDKFQGRGGLTDAYNFAMKDLKDAISSLSEKQRTKIFQDGASFMNLEVIWPDSVNVIPYGQPLLVFHSTMQYDEDGKAIGQNVDAAKMLAGMIKQVEKDVQSNYTIQGPPMITLPKTQKLSAKKSKYTTAISKLQKEFKLKDSDGVAEYHQAWWSDYIDKKSPTVLDDSTKKGLVKRWAFMEKSFRLDTKNIPDADTLKWAKKVDGDDNKKLSKDNLMKFEDIFLGVGADILEFTTSVLTVNSDEATKKMKTKMEKTIADVKKSKDSKKIEKLKLELRRLNAIGGMDKIVPNEGIVFTYGKGKDANIFKLTGSFASLNQLLGIFF